MALTSQRFCLRWNNHQSNLLSVFDQLLHDEAFVDVTLAVEGQFLRAHKMILSACSPYFQVSGWIHVLLRFHIHVRTHMHPYTYLPTTPNKTKPNQKSLEFLFSEDACKTALSSVPSILLEIDITLKLFITIFSVMS